MFKLKSKMNKRRRVYITFAEKRGRDIHRFRFDCKQSHVCTSNNRCYHEHDIDIQSMLFSQCC